MFENARLKLTIWYLVIIMVISLFFSVVIYINVTSEFKRFERMNLKVQEELIDGGVNSIPKGKPVIRVGRPDPDVIQAARTRIFLTLGFINLVILGFSGAAGYFLAGRTLSPIKKSVDEQNRFITDASHELKTPLTSLRSEIEVALRSKKTTTEQARKLLESNLEEVLNLQTLSDNLLELAQNGRLIDPKNMSTVAIVEIISSAVKKVDPLARKKQIKLESKIRNVNVYGIKDRLIEVFVILLDNAIKYSSDKSTIELELKKAKKRIEVLVINYGIEIEERDLPHIFERFYRADRSRSQVGYGLGLSIAKKIIIAHGGTISAKSLPNKKTTFKLTLPI